MTGEGVYRMVFDYLLTLSSDTDKEGFCCCDICGRFFHPDGKHWQFRIYKNGEVYTHGNSCHVCPTADVRTIRNSFTRLANHYKRMSVDAERHRRTLLDVVSQFPETVTMIQEVIDGFETILNGDHIESELALEYAKVVSVVTQQAWLEDEESPPKLNGYVYLIGSPEGYCKIGRTVNLSSRIHAISLQLPFKVELLHSIEVSDPVRAERFLHQKFSTCRANGEWFLLSVEDINWIKSQTSLEGLY